MALVVVLLVALACLGLYTLVRRPRPGCHDCQRRAELRCCLCGMRFCQRHCWPTTTGLKAVTQYPGQWMCPRCFSRVEDG